MSSVREVGTKVVAGSECDDADVDEDGCGEQEGAVLWAVAALQATTRMG